MKYKNGSTCVTVNLPFPILTTRSDSYKNGAGKYYGLVSKHIHALIDLYLLNISNLITITDNLFKLKLI